MANFDSNRWYQLLVASASDAQSMDGSVLYDHGKGAAFFQNTNTSSPEQQWQLYPYDSSNYILRTKGSGPDGYLNAAVSATEDTPGHTTLDMRNSTYSDNSVLWQISPWGDGTFFFTNAANGSDWHMNVKSNSLMSMSSNITAPQDGQSFSFKQLDVISNTKFSTINPVLATILSPPSATDTSTSATTTSTTSSSASTSATTSSSGSTSTGLSAGATAAIGASIGGVALLVIIGLVYFFLRRRKRRAVAEIGDQQPAQELAVPPVEETYHKDPVKEKPQVPLAELDAPPVELHGDSAPQELPRHPDQ